MTKKTPKKKLAKRPEYQGQPEYIVRACTEAEHAIKRLSRRIAQYRNVASANRTREYDGYTGQQIRRGDPGPLADRLAGCGHELLRIEGKLIDACQGPKSA